VLPVIREVCFAIEVCCGVLVLLQVRISSVGASASAEQFVLKFVVEADLTKGVKR